MVDKKLLETQRKFYNDSLKELRTRRPDVNASDKEFNEWNDERRRLLVQRMEVEDRLEQL